MAIRVAGESCRELVSMHCLRSWVWPCDGRSAQVVRSLAYHSVSGVNEMTNQLPPKPKPCPFCGVELEYDQSYAPIRIPTWNHPFNDCWIGHGLELRFSEEKSWNTRTIDRELLRKILTITEYPDDHDAVEGIISELTKDEKGGGDGR